MQAVSTGEPVNQDLALNLYQRLASGEYHIASVCNYQELHCRCWLQRQLACTCPTIVFVLLCMLRRFSQSQGLQGI